VPSPFRPGSALDRLFGKRVERSISPFELSHLLGGWGAPATFKPQESLRAYGDNVWLYRAVLSIAMEIAGGDFRLRTVKKNGEVECV
jgi:hypothetical protein